MSKLTGEQRDMLKMYAHKQDAEGLYEFVEGLLDVAPVIEFHADTPEPPDVKAEVSTDHEEMT